jgi:hypothetical protein
MDRHRNETQMVSDLKIMVSRSHPMRSTQHNACPRSLLSVAGALIPGRAQIQRAGCRPSAWWRVRSSFNRTDQRKDEGLAEH